MDEKISKLFLPILEKLYNTEPAGEPFRKPVDPVKYACYDYYIFVEHPIDLSTIRQRLINHQYEGDAWRFIADIELMLSNAFAFNKKGTTVYEFTNRLNKIWTSEISSIMQRMNYCCGNTYKFGPQLLFCHGTTPDKYCQIAIGAKYKCYEDSYSFCIPCFNKIRTEYISLQTLTCETSRMNLPTQPVKKSDFIDCTNDRWQYEAFIKCTQCSRRLHQICELYLAHEDEIKECPQHEQIEEEQKQRCSVPPEFAHFAKPGNKITATLPPTDSQSSIDAELLAFARDVDDSNNQSIPGSPNPDDNVNNHYDCAKDNRLDDGLSQSDDIRHCISISRNNSTYTSYSQASPNIRNSVDNIAARLSINKLSAENQADNGKQQLTVATLKRDKFVCNHCYRKERLGFNLRHRKYSARRLPHTRMSRFIETKVNEYIRENSPTAGEMTVRVLTAYRDKVDVKKEMKSFLRQQRSKDNSSHPNLENYPDDFEFTTRAIFAWQEIDGVDVCVFGMHVQEYGEDCPEPNKQVVYLSYLDSVHFFRPKQFRTAVYHEILLSYFKYVKKLGFRRVFIWVCPSRKGDDYIFYRHPSEQKMPTLKRLSDWYVHLLDKGVANGIIERHQNIYEYAMSENWTSILSMPYLSGDYWPGEFERLLSIMIESQKRYDERMTFCKQEVVEELDQAVAEEHDRGEYLLNDPLLEQNNVLSLSNLYQRASTGIQKPGSSGKMISLKNPVLGSLGLKTQRRNSSVMGDHESGDIFSVADPDESKFFEPFTPNSTRSDDQPLDLSKSTSAASPESCYDDDQTDVTWKEPCSRKRRRKSSSTMGYTKKRNRGTNGKSRVITADVLVKSQNNSQKGCRLKTGLRSSADPIDTMLSPEEEMLKNLERSLKRQREGFIVVRLSECDCSPHFESLRRKEESVFTCDLMRGREPFLQLARLKNYEFSTLRRAKFSSLAMVKHLSETFKLEPICNECFSFDSSKHHYICEQCNDYYLCTSCYENTRHEHTMLPLQQSMQPDIDEFLQQCPPASTANSISSASSTISNKSFNDTSPEVLAQSSTTPSKNDPELIIDNNIPLNRQISNGLGPTSSMPLGCKRQRNWALSLESRTEDEENANFDPFASSNKLSLSHRASPPPSHSSNRVRNNNLELDQVLIDNVIRQTELDYNIDFDEMKGESKKLLSHYFACPIKETCLRCKFVVLSCSFMSLLMRSSRMQMMINCHPSDMPISSNGQGNSNSNIASDGINLTTKRRFG
jgi:hypothetical protein